MESWTLEPPKLWEIHCCLSSPVRGVLFTAVQLVETSACQVAGQLKFQCPVLTTASCPSCIYIFLPCFSRYLPSYHHHPIALYNTRISEHFWSSYLIKLSSLSPVLTPGPCQKLPSTSLIFPFVCFTIFFTISEVWVIPTVSSLCHCRFYSCHLSWLDRQSNLFQKTTKKNDPPLTFLATTNMSMLPNQHLRSSFCPQAWISENLMGVCTSPSLKIRQSPSLPVFSVLVGTSSHPDTLELISPFFSLSSMNFPIVRSGMCSKLQQLRGTWKKTNKPEIAQNKQTNKKILLQENI